MAAAEKSNAFVSIDLQEGVPVSFLADLFNLRMETVRQRLAQCPRKQVKGRGYFYDLAKACEFLIDPKVDIEKYIATMKPEDLPPKLRKAYWDAMIQQQNWGLTAGELWRTEDVINAFSEVFSALKATVQLWPDHVSRVEGLTPEQRKVLVELGDMLQTDLYGRIEGLVADKSAPNLAVRFAEGQKDTVEQHDIVG